MAANDKTTSRFQHLQALSRQGYRSDTIDHSLDSIIALVCIATHWEYADILERLQAFALSDVPRGLLPMLSR